MCRRSGVFYRVGMVRGKRDRVVNRIAQNQPVEQRNPEKGCHDETLQQCIAGIRRESQKGQGKTEQIDRTDIVAERQQVLRLWSGQLTEAVLFGDGLGA